MRTSCRSAKATWSLWRGRRREDGGRARSTAKRAGFPAITSARSNSAVSPLLALRMSETSDFGAAITMQLHVLFTRHREASVSERNPADQELLQCCEWKNSFCLSDYRLQARICPCCSYLLDFSISLGSCSLSVYFSFKEVGMLFLYNYVFMWPNYFFWSHSAAVCCFICRWCRTFWNTSESLSKNYRQC